jgi:regulator of protease activity HflC (stomatin/prohibitin superfamily)
MVGFTPLFIILVVLAISSIKVINEYERAVVFILGRFNDVAGPGIIFVVPGIMQMFRISLRTVVLDVPPQDVITKDNVSVKVNAVVYFRVIDAKSAVLQVENFLFATSQISQTTLRSVLGQLELDQLLTDREKVNSDLQKILDLHTEPWGIKVSNVEVKNVDLPEEMISAISRQAQAERERRAKIIHAEGEQQASAKLAEAAQTLTKSAGAMQLRYLQTLTEVASDKNTTTIFPVPIDLIEMFVKRGGSNS